MAEAVRISTLPCVVQPSNERVRAAVAESYQRVTAVEAGEGRIGGDGVFGGESGVIRYDAQITVTAAAQAAQEG